MADQRLVGSRTSQSQPDVNLESQETPKEKRSKPDDSCLSSKRSKETCVVTSVISQKVKCNSNSPNKTSYRPAVMNKVAFSDYASNSLVNGKSESADSELVSDVICEPNSSRLNACPVNGETAVSNENNFASSCNSAKDINKEDVSNDLDNANDAEWKSVEARRKKRDAVSKSRETVVSDGRTFWSTGRAVAGSANIISDCQPQRSVGASSSSRASVSQKLLKNEETQPVITTSLNLDSTSFPELPVSSGYRISAASMPLISELANDSSDLESTKSVQMLHSQSCANGQSVSTSAESNSYASIVSGAKWKQASANVGLASSAISQNKQVVSKNSDIIITSCNQELNDQSQVTCSSISTSDISFTVPADEYPAVINSSALCTSYDPLRTSDIGETSHSKNYTNSSVACGEQLRLADQCFSLDLQGIESSGSIISFGDVRLFPGETISSSLSRSLTEDVETCHWATASNDSIPGAEYIANNELSARHVITSSNNLNNGTKSIPPKRSSLFFDTRVKCTTLSSEQSFNIVFGFDSAVPMLGCLAETNTKNDLCKLSISEKSVRASSGSSSIIISANKSTEMNFPRTMAVNSCSSSSCFDISSAQTYFNTAFNEVMTQRKIDPNGVVYYGIDLQ